MTPELEPLLHAALEMVRYYRSRAHHVNEDEDGNFGYYHTVYGVHHEAMKAADLIVAAARDAGLLVPAADMEQYHAA